MKRVFLSSRIRRGRMATSPVWLAAHDGQWLQFGRKRDAKQFEEHGCEGHPQGLVCPCAGREPDVDVAKLEAQTTAEARPGTLRIESWAGRTTLKVQVLAECETKARYRVRFLEGAGRYSVGEERLVPKYAVTFDLPATAHVDSTESTP